MMAKDDWHLDKKVPIAFLLTLIIHTGAAIWFASSLNSRVATLEISRQNSIAAYDRLIRLETNFDNMKDAINRIDANLAKLAEREYDNLRRKTK